MFHTTKHEGDGNLERSLNNIPFATQVWSDTSWSGVESRPSFSNEWSQLDDCMTSKVSLHCDENGNNKAMNRSNKYQRKRAPSRRNDSLVGTKYLFDPPSCSNSCCYNCYMDNRILPRNEEELFCGSHSSGLLGDVALDEEQDYNWEDENKSGLPTELSLCPISRFLQVSGDRLTVRYVGSASYEYDVGTIQANKPIPTGIVDIFYFEVEILSCDAEHVSIAIGLSKRLQDFCKSIGEEPGSFAYRGRDGKIKSHGSVAIHYATPYQQGDVIGCGYLFETRQIFFTKNGVMLGIAFSQVSSSHPLYASVSLHYPNEKVSFRFGGLDEHNSFHDVWRNEWKEYRRKQIQAVDLSPDIPFEYVVDYLLRCGYPETLEAFQLNTDGMVSPKAEILQVKARGKVRQWIMQGKIQQAIHFIQEHKPMLLQVGSWSLFALTCQRWIEWLRQEGTSHCCLSKLVQVSVSYLSHLIPWMDGEQKRFFYRMLVLLAFEEPLESPMKHLFSIWQRCTVADIVNDAWLEAENVDPSTRMESLWKQSRMIERCLFYDTFMK